MTTDFITEDFLLDNDAARELYHSYAERSPIVDFHNHLDVNDLVNDIKHEDIGGFWVCADKYKHRAMRIAGVDERLITGNADNQEKFNAWCKLMPYTMGNPLFHWSCLEMKEIFGIDQLPSEENAEEIWSACNIKLASDEYSSNAILRRLNVRYLTTSDDIMADVSLHRKASTISGFSVTPSLRADSALAFDSAKFVDWFENTGAEENLEGYIDFLRTRLDVFDTNGCRLSDHALDNGFRYIRTSKETASEIFTWLISMKHLSETDICCLRSFILEFLATEYACRGWVMQLHIGAERWTNSRLRTIAGPAGGYASIGNSCCLKSICSFLDGLDVNGFMPKTILYTLNPADNALLATLTGSFSQSGVQKLQFGPAWWYNDHKYGIEENLKNLSSYSLMFKSLGMTTDSRTILSFSRHAYFRRILCNYLGEMIEKKQLPDDMSFIGEAVMDISYRNAERWIYGNE